MRRCSWNHVRKVSESLWRDGNRRDGRFGVSHDPQDGRGKTDGAKPRSTVVSLAAVIVAGGAVLIAKRGEWLRSAVCNRSRRLIFEIALMPDGA